MENNRDNINFPSFSGFLILNSTDLEHFCDFLLEKKKNSVMNGRAWRFHKVSKYDTIWQNPYIGKE